MEDIKDAGDRCRSRLKGKIWKWKKGKKRKEWEKGNGYWRTSKQDSMGSGTTERVERMMIGDREGETEEEGGR